MRGAVATVLRESPWLDAMVRRQIWSRISSPEPELRWLKREHPKFELCVDVGAADAIYTDVLMRHSRHVLAFEPNVESLKGLRWRQKADRCTVFPYAVSVGSGEATMFVPRSGRFGTTLSPVAGSHSDGDNCSVSTVSLDQLLPAYERIYGRCGFLKIDVEGHEHAVLSGALGLLKNSRPLILIELEVRHGVENVANALDVLEDSGYRVRFLVDQYRMEAISNLDDLRRLQLNVDARTERLKSSLNWSRRSYVNNFLCFPPDAP